MRAELEESKQKAIKELENAKREIETQLNAQKCSYEQEIKALGTSLEQQKIALEKTNQQKRELEIEKDLLASEVERNNRMKELLDNSRIHVTPYKSNFLQELQSILAENTAEVESALRMKLSDEAIKAGGVSLHEMQLLVREATERCRDVGVNYVSIFYSVSHISTQTIHSSLSIFNFSGTPPQGHIKRVSISERQTFFHNFIITTNIQNRKTFQYSIKKSQKLNDTLFSLYS